MRPAPRWITAAAAASLLSLCAAGLFAGRAYAEPQLTGLCRTPAPTSASAADHIVHAGAWSYFGDPRSIARGSRIFTGCVGTNRGIVVEQYDRRTGESFHVHVHRNREVDDHDNPSIALWRRRVYAFYSPHSGRYFPRNRQSEMHIASRSGRSTSARASASSGMSRPTREEALASRTPTRWRPGTSCSCSGAVGTGFPPSPTPVTACTG